MNSTPAQQTNDDDKPDFVTLHGLAMYAKVFEPSAYNTEYSIPSRWEVDLLLSKTEAEKARAKGLAIKDNDKYKGFCEAHGHYENGYEGAFIKIKKNSMRKKWDSENGVVEKDAQGQPVLEPAVRPRVVDSHGTAIPEEADLLVGNGSEIEVTAIITKPNIAGKEQFGRFGGRLIETKILDLVEYKRPEGSFTFESSSAKTDRSDYVAAQETAQLSEDEIPFLPNED